VVVTNMGSEDYIGNLERSTSKAVDQFVIQWYEQNASRGVEYHHKLAPSLYECFYNTLTICSTFNVDTIIDMMLK
jgi:hypothetical protein